jgi:intracellular sulfur oxidation DsrE/DsrF family protein
MAAEYDRGGRLVRTLAALAMMLALAAALTSRPPRGGDPSQGERPLRVVVHVDFAQTTHERQGLSNITNILKAAGDDGLKAEVEVVCHAEGIRLVEKARTELADEVAALADRGVRFVACENTMRQRSLAVADLLPGVATVPSGAYEIVRQQQEGYSYFKP